MEQVAFLILLYLRSMGVMFVINVIVSLLFDNDEIIPLKLNAIISLIIVCIISLFI